jgi:hypothetical protein
MKFVDFFAGKKLKRKENPIIQLPNYYFISEKSVYLNLEDEGLSTTFS